MIDNMINDRTADADHRTANVDIWSWAAIIFAILGIVGGSLSMLYIALPLGLYAITRRVWVAALPYALQIALAASARIAFELGVLG